jgi:hypothetical protein
LIGWDDSYTFTGIIKIASEFYNKRQFNNTIFKYSGQIGSLEALLTNRSSIYEDANVTIEDALRTPKVYLHNTGEIADADYLFNTSEPDYEPFYVYNIEDYESEVDFIVRVHLETVTDDHKAYLASFVDIFKIAGKKYLILAEDE